ncbi:MAG: transcriptional repressor NrdR [Alphaproteobacteria bacterium]|nr:transcriptional repressor NrdR [Alphaproteobacteria bacterium]MBQ3117601.1 transcriptional repressor NrdR [Alphaproteobacteria bacterium]MBQ6854324.1 transcriptional repressor NrdR [Alphaproteobacteria bacterium]MBQ8557241.1 transcriptional repressor NrdR [Alphaproteobacteria bacterium]MBR3912827.1 transcriptional repressor NrdR [Alphaproteobacteria bacterium]
MRCPFCGCMESQVKDSRPSEDSSSIRRRRQCPQCGGRFTTFEYIQSKDLIVVKKNDVRVPFEREKLYRSVLLAIGKREISAEQIDRIVDEIVQQLEELNDMEILSSQIGEMVLDKLFQVDKIAYIRYASVYKNFNSMADFKEFALKLVEE